MTKRQRVINSALDRVRRWISKHRLGRTRLAACFAGPTVAAVLVLSAVGSQVNPRWLEVEGMRSYEQFSQACNSGSTENEGQTEDDRRFPPNNNSTKFKCEYIQQTVESDLERAIERSSQLENLLIALGGLLLGVSAYFGALIFGKEALEPRQARRPYRIAMVLLVCTSAAYMHVFKILLGTMMYMVRLEHFGRPVGLRFFVSTIATTSHANVPGLSALIAGTQLSIMLVAIFPLVIMAGALFAGTRLGWELDAVLALAVVIVGVLLVFILPTAIETFP